VPAVKALFRSIVTAKVICGVERLNLRECCITLRASEISRLRAVRRRIQIALVVFGRSLYLDGNNLQCQGATDLIRPFADEAIFVDAEKQLLAEAAAAAAAAAAASVDVGDEYDDVLTESLGQHGGHRQGQGE